jgi:hypothetical protein
MSTVDCTTKRHSTRSRVVDAGRASGLDHLRGAHQHLADVVQLVSDAGRERAQRGEALGAQQLVGAACELRFDRDALPIAEVPIRLHEDQVLDAREQLALVDGFHEEVVGARRLRRHA